MNPLFITMASGATRWAIGLVLGGVFKYFIDNGVWTTGDVEKLITALVGGALVLAWSLWEKREAWEVTLTALLMPKYTSYEAAKIEAKLRRK